MPKISKISIKKTADKSKKIIVVKKKLKSAVKISKTYIPKDTEKYMCEKHLAFFKVKLTEWKK